MPIEAEAMTVEALDHVVVNVTDVERAADWYARALGMKRQEFDERGGKSKRVSMLFGRQKINLRPVTADKIEWFTADHEQAGSDDLCFLTAATPQQVVEHLGACGVAIEEGPVKRQGAVGTLTSVYCRDPDGSLIEIASYDR
ncbi:VOC family protein [Afipia sp. TerB]